MCTSCRSLQSSDQELPSAKQVTYSVDLKRVFKTKLVLGIADGWLAVIGFPPPHRRSRRAVQMSHSHGLA
jgi:hypothetical protein